MARTLNYLNLYTNYPKQDDVSVVNALIGGDIKADAPRNTCAIRMSRALNYSGLQIPAHLPSLYTRSGADGLSYAYRMQELKAYLTRVLGNPAITATKSPVMSINRNVFAGKKRIIAFDIHFRDGPNGHIDLWDGKTFIHEHIAGKSYFALATKVCLWTAK